MMKKFKKDQVIFTIIIAVIIIAFLMRRVL